MFSIGAFLLPIAITIFSFSTFLVSFILGFTLLSIALGLVISLTLTFHSVRFFKTIGQVNQKTAAVIFMLSLSLLFPLFDSHSLKQTSLGLISGGGAWGDYALHSTIIMHFANTSKISLDHPLLFGHKLTYPFLIDFFSSILVKLGFSLRLALLIPGLILASNLVLLVFIVSQKLASYWLFRNQKLLNLSGILTSLIFFLNGGLGFGFAIYDFLTSKVSFWEWLTQLSVSYTFNGQHNIFFSNIVADYLLPQRPVLLGLSLSLIVLWCLWQALENPYNKRAFLCLAGLLYGLLPFGHQHSFLALGIVIPLTLVFHHYGNLNNQSFKEKTAGLLNDAFLIGIPAAIIAIPQLAWYFSQLEAGRYLQVKIGWMTKNESVLLFWLKNAGLLLPLGILATLQAPKYLGFLLAPFWILWVVTNIIQFQPYDYDNMKPMLYWLFVLSSAIATLLILWIRKVLLLPSTPLKVLTFTILCFTFLALTTSGVLTIIRESHLKWLLYDNEAINLAQWVKLNTNSSDLFLTTDAHNHPVPGLTGRPVVMGYKGWLWSHGLNYQQIELDVSAMHQNKKLTPSLLKKYRVKYIVTETKESFSYSRVYVSAKYQIYQVL